jgi:hypothetical protein
VAGDDEESQRRKDDLDLEYKEPASHFLTNSIYDARSMKRINLGLHQVAAVIIMPKASVKWVGGQVPGQ